MDSKFCLLTLTLGIGSLMAVPSIAHAQITADGTANTTIDTTGLHTTITNGTATGSNLFHSFQQFSIPTGGSATFNLVNTPTIRTIFSRVTGGSLSNIDGLIQTSHSSNPVSLFLINPAGIVFGPNASLNIGGSFFASTASRFQFANGTEFSATHRQAPPILTINVPLGLQTGGIAPGSTIVNRGNLTTGQDLTLAADRLDLQGQLVAGRDLTLSAQSTVQIRDTATAPFVANSGRDLLIQGTQGIDIFTLNHGRSQFQSGGTLSLVSDGTISGDAHFASGGFQVRSLSGQLAQFTSLYDPIISSTGDVDIAGSYTGASLLIESLGSVQIQGFVNINAPDTVSSFVGSDAILSTRPGLMIRSGQPSLVYGGVNQNNPPAYTNSTVPSGITLLAPVIVEPFGTLGGVVNLLAGTGDLNATSIITENSTGGEGGAISLTTANGNLRVSGILYSASTATTGDSGNGGAVTLAATNGDLTIEGSIFSASGSFTGNSGNGGAITLSVTHGNLLLTDGTLDSSSRSDGGSSAAGGAIALAVINGNLTATNGSLNASSYSQLGIAGTGGAISFSTTNGALINNDVLYSFSNASNGTSGTGGAIALSSTNGDLTNNGNLDSSSTSYLDKSGNGGAIAFSSTHGSLINNGYVNSASFGGANSGNGGTIAFSSTHGDLTNNGIVFSFSASSGNSGDGGAIDLSSTHGNLTNTGFVGAFSLSEAGNSGNGGAIALATQNGNILTSGDISSFSYSLTGNSSNGGAIDLAAQNGNILGENGTLNSFSVAPEGTSSVGGNVRLTAQNQVTGLQILTTSSSAQAGSVTIAGQSDLTIADTTILTSKQVTINTPLTGSFTIPVGGSGRSGDVNISSAGNLTLTHSQIESDTKGSDSAGSVTLTSPSLASFNNSQILSSTSGTGQAGNITVTAGQGISLTQGSRIAATTTSTGNAGDISLTSPTVVISGDAQITAATQGSGRGGSIIVNAPTAVNLVQTQDAAPILSVATSGAGSAGEIVVNTPSLTLSDSARIIATATATATNAEGGGSISLNASQMNLAGIVGVFAETQGQSPAGTLRLNPYANDPTLTVFLAPQSQISASTNGSGRGGDLIITAPESITLTGGGKLTAETNSSGNAGNLSLTTRQLTIADGVELSASTSGSGNAGGGGIRADRATFSQGGRVVSNTSSSGAAGDITLNLSDQLTLNGAGTGLFASTTPGSTGKGGNIAVQAKTTLLQDQSTIAVNSLGSGAGGNINLATGQLTLNNGVELSASTSGSGNAGNLSIRADRATFSQGGRIVSNTSSTGAAGDITLNLSNQLTLNGAGTGLFASTTPGSTGKGGNIAVQAKTTLLQDQSTIAVNSLGSGAGGNITVAADRVTLDTRASLTAETASTQGGNINLEVRDVLMLRRNSLISTTAGTAQAGGNGGNITIRTPNGFIIAVLSENSDIRANAFTGNGGKIRITSQGIFGLQFQPQNTPRSDITASSQFGFNGTVQINNLGGDPTSGVVQLPGALVDPSQQIATGCNAQGSRFVVTGRGGLPSNPTDQTSGDRTWSDIREVAQLQPSGQRIAQAQPVKNPIVEASRLQRHANGTLELTAARPPALSPWATCANPAKE